MKIINDILKSEKTIFQLIRYGFVGGVAFVADYLTLYLLTDVAGVNYLWSAAIAFIIGLIVNYILSNLIVFTTHRLKKRWVEFMVFAIIGVIGLGLNELIMYCSSDLLGLHYMVSKLISTVIVFFWNFFARKLTLFNK